MQIFFAGAEVSSHLGVLRSCGVERVAVSVSNLVRQRVDLKAWATRSRLDGLEWVLYADSQHVPVGPAMEILAGAEVAPECVTGPAEWYETTWLSDSDLMFLPTWDATDPGKLREYTETFDGVFLPDAVVDNPSSVRTAKAALNRLGVLGALTGRSKGLERFDMLCSSAWYAVQKYGETQVWVGNRLVRLNSDDKQGKRERYAPAMEELGLDVAKVLADDPTETVKLAVLSWMALEHHIARGHTTVSEVTRTGGTPSSSNVVPITGGVASPPAIPRHKMLPVISLSSAPMKVTDAEGNEVEELHNTIAVSPNSMRQCDSCSIALGCPGFVPHSSCSYQIPVMLRTKGQLLALLRAMTEIQSQRILMGRFSEEINGAADPDVGREMDRLFSMVEKWKEIEDNRDTVRMTLEAKGDPDNRKTTAKNAGRRLKDFRAGVYMQTLLRDPAAGIMHSLIYFSFLILLAVTTVLGDQPPAPRVGQVPPRRRVPGLLRRSATPPASCSSSA